MRLQVYKTITVDYGNQVIEVRRSAQAQAAALHQLVMRSGMPLRTDGVGLQLAD
jgi:hypothetical protein